MRACSPADFELRYTPLPDATYYPLVGAVYTSPMEFARRGNNHCMLGQEESRKEYKEKVHTLVRLKNSRPRPLLKVTLAGPRCPKIYSPLGWDEGRFSSATFAPRLPGVVAQEVRALSVQLHSLLPAEVATTSVRRCRCESRPIIARSLECRAEGWCRRIEASRRSSARRACACASSSRR